MSYIIGIALLIAGCISTNNAMIITSGIFFISGSMDNLASAIRNRKN